MPRAILEDIIKEFGLEKFTTFFRRKNPLFRNNEEDFSSYNEGQFGDGSKIGEITFSDTQSLIICAFSVNGSLTERTGKRAQYDLGKKILRAFQKDGGIFIFYDDRGNFRFSLIYPEYRKIGIRVAREWNNFRRSTYFVDRELPNKNFLNQIGKNDFSSLEKIKEAFSISTVTDQFYREFFEHYQSIEEGVIDFKRDITETGKEKAKDFILLFAIRTIFLGFIQKRGWIGNDMKFLQNFLKEYETRKAGENQFYKRWLCPLFFEALNSPIGRKVAFSDNEFSTETEQALQMAPFLNGGLFKEKSGYDDQGFIIPDKQIKEFFDFLFSHNFTIEENTYFDEDLELNPEFLGIIFERLINKANGAVYTPRVEVDLMCRLSLEKWLEQKTKIEQAKLYRLLFNIGDDSASANLDEFSIEEAQIALDTLGNCSICDPAVGSGAFPVGMLQVIDEVEDRIRQRLEYSDVNSFEHKKRIVSRSLYGVEVKEWAVWICQLRLWITLFIEAPEELRNSLEPILPSLDFKIRQGDSLIQRIGGKMFPVLGHAAISKPAIKAKVTQLKNIKAEFFKNEFKNDWEIRQKELGLYEEILKNEIEEKQNALNALKGNVGGAQGALFAGGVDAVQERLKLDEKKESALKIEISQLREQLTSLRRDKPLIWSIEFAEIFVEKGGFDIVIGNPPYVRQEGIADPMDKIKDHKTYKNLLADMVRLDFSENFSTDIKINAQSDLYTYFYMRGLRLLNPEGIHTFICSNSWLDVGYGVWLQNFLLNRCPIHFIIDNQAKRSFAAADVNTIISIIGAPQKKVDQNHLVKFVAFKKPFEEVISVPNLLAIEETKAILSNENYRVYPIAVKDLISAGTEYESEAQEKMKLGQYIGDKWGGKYLRAPDIFFTILEKGKDKLVKLGDIADVRFGIKTGANEFFYLDDDLIKKWQIEPEFLKPVIKSPRECKSILVDPKGLKYKIFICNKSKEELKGTNALKYIQWGEKQKTKDGVYWKDVPSVSGRKFWWSVGEQIGNIFWVKEVNDRLAAFISDQEISADCRLYYANVKADISLYCNSSIYGLFAEVLTRAGLGLGARSLMVFEVQTSVVLPHLFTDLSVFQQFMSRDIKPIFEECGINPQSDTPIEEQEPKPLPDRAELDKIVFDALGLTEDERKDVYRAVCRLVWNRISKAKSV